MAEVNVGDLWKVVITEYEAGWGQRCDPSDTKFFTTMEEAIEYKGRWETGCSPEYYWRGEITKIS